MRVRPIILSALAAAALLTGCQSAITGTPVGSPKELTEPTVATPRPSRTATAAPTPPRSMTPAPPPSAAAAPPPADVLAPENGYVFIQTKSGKTRCQLSSAEVGCESQFVDAPDVDGLPANGVRLSSDGQMQWVLGNLGAIPAVTLDYRTYSAVGWTIQAGSDGTRITNDRTHRGMVISVQRVQTF